MAKFNVVDMNGQHVSEIELSDAVFGITPNEKAVHIAVVNFLANQRQGTQNTKIRMEVSGGGTPYLLRDQGKVKGNVIIIAGGGSTHRNNVVEGYPVAEFFNKNGYNAFVLQRRVNPYAAVDQQLDLARAIRYIRHNASEKHIGKTDIMIAVGFSAGGMNVMQVVADQFGTTNTPDKVYPSYVCDAVDHESADLNVAIPIYGLFVTGLNFTKNPNLPPVFGVVGQKDGLSAMMLPSLPECADIFKDFSFYLAPDAPHGVGLGTGTKGYVDYYTQIAQWPDMAVNFIESRLGLMEKKIDMDSVGFAW